MVDQSIALLLGVFTFSCLSFSFPIHPPSRRPRDLNIRCKLLADDSFQTLGACSDKDVISFMRDGHLFKKDMFTSSSLLLLRSEVETFLQSNQLEALRHKVQVSLGEEEVESLTQEECEEMLASVGGEYIPFLQLFNLWRGLPAAKRVACSAELGRIAADLLGVPAVRLYQDSLFAKRAGDGPTQWHTDLNMAPFDSNQLVTCWIPLQPIPAPENGGSSLLFASGSHRYSALPLFRSYGGDNADDASRDFALPYWYDLDSKELEDRYEVVAAGAFSLGDCSFHHG